MVHPFIKINGREYPAPDRGLGFLVSTTVNSGRNEKNVMKGQRVGRDIHKIDNVVWYQLNADTWASLLQEFERDLCVTVEFPDMVHNCWQTKIMYPGDRSAQPLLIDERTGLPSIYKNCKCNLIDTGR